MNTKPLTDENGEIREITSEDMKRFKKSSEVLPEELLTVLPNRERPLKNPEKERKTMALPITPTPILRGKDVDKFRSYP